jgi:hypothetical protein
MNANDIIIAKKNLGIGGEYKIVKDWVYNKKNGDKRFSAYQRLDLFIEKFENEQRESNARHNSKLVFEFLENQNVKCDYKSIYGSRYYTINGKYVRVSNHHYTSEMYKECDYNFCSYKLNGHLEIIESLKLILN